VQRFSCACLHLQAQQASRILSFDLPYVCIYVCAANQAVEIERAKERFYKEQAEARARQLQEEAEYKAAWDKYYRELEEYNKYMAEEAAKSQPPPQAQPAAAYPQPYYTMPLYGSQMYPAPMMAYPSVVSAAPVSGSVPPAAQPVVAGSVPPMYASYPAFTGVPMMAAPIMTNPLPFM
jgi:hypothetical protein